MPNDFFGDLEFRVVFERNIITTRKLQILFLLFFMIYFLVAAATDAQLPKPGMFEMSTPGSPGGVPDSGDPLAPSRKGWVPSKY